MRVFSRIRLGSGGAASARSPACAAQIRAHHVCHRVSPEEIEGAIDDMRHMTSDAGVDLVVMNADFYETGAVASVSRAASRNRLPFLNHVAQYKQLLLMNQLQSARQLGLAPPHVPTVRLRPADPTQPPRPQQLVLRVRVARPGVNVSVRGSTGLRDDTFDEPMYDDGTHGDEVAGDRVFSTTLEIPDTIFRRAKARASCAETSSSSMGTMRGSASSRVTAVPYAL